MVKISVIVPPCNACAFLGDTIESVLEQDTKAWEVVPVNDGSIHIRARWRRFMIPYFVWTLLHIAPSEAKYILLHQPGGLDVIKFQPNRSNIK